LPVGNTAGRRCSQNIFRFKSLVNALSTARAVVGTGPLHGEGLAEFEHLGVEVFEADEAAAGEERRKSRVGGASARRDPSRFPSSARPAAARNGNAPRARWSSGGGGSRPHGARARRSSGCRRARP